MPKRFLIIKASSDICAAEIDNMKTIADMFGIEHCATVLTEMEQFRKDLCAGGNYDYVYLAAHADLMGFGEIDGSVSIEWKEFAEALCDSDCLNVECILLLGCCRGGLQKVASQLFYYCSQIDYVCGPRWTVSSEDISAGFHVFVYNMEIRREQPSTAVERASLATGYDFFCHDRVEFEDTYQPGAME